MVRVRQLRIASLMAKRRGCARQSPNTEARRFRDDTRRGGMPSVYRRTTEVAIKPLSQVDETFARDEGEGDRTRDWWLDAHRRYFARQATREGFEMDDEILTVFERSRWSGRSMSRRDQRADFSVDLMRAN
jgi:hypothetical protein